MASTALILGVTGGFGCEMARALRQHGWQVRAMHRKPKSAARALGDMGFVDWVKGDAMNAGDVREAAEGVSLIVHAVNPPGYRNWQTLVLPMIDNTIAAACAANPGGRTARVVLPGTVYNYDPARTPLVDETTPQQPASRKGAVRVELERRLERAAPEVPQHVLLAVGEGFGGVGRRFGRPTAGATNGDHDLDIAVGDMYLAAQLSPLRHAGIASKEGVSGELRIKTITTRRQIGAHFPTLPSWPHGPARHLEPANFPPGQDTAGPSPGSGG